MGARLAHGGRHVFLGRMVGRRPADNGVMISAVRFSSADPPVGRPVRVARAN